MRTLRTSVPVSIEFSSILTVTSAFLLTLPSTAVNCRVSKTALFFTVCM